MKLLFHIAGRHLFFRKRQSLVSLFGIILGVAFFLAISSLMLGSQRDFVKRLIDNSPHITIYDEYRNPRKQAVEMQFPSGAIEIRSVKPLTETRGIRNFEQILSYLRSLAGTEASPSLVGQALVSFAGRDFAVNLNGMIPEEMRKVTTIHEHMKEGSLEDLTGNPDGLIIGQALARKLSIKYGDNIILAATTGQVRTFKVVGLFRSGRVDFDERQVFANLKRVQALLNRSDRINNILVKLRDPDSAHGLAAHLEKKSLYKSISWQEMSEDILSTLKVRNVILYTVVSAVLIVAAFGIYNVISTVVMEKHRDISILKSMGFLAEDIQKIFLIQGVILGLVGCSFGLPIGMGLMIGLMQIRLNVPGGTDPIPMPIDWGWIHFALAGTFAMGAALFAAYLPARKAARVRPVDILRGGT